MLVYALQGKRNTGKTLTLATLFTMICKQYGKKANILFPYGDFSLELIEEQIKRKYKALQEGVTNHAPYIRAMIEINGIRIGIHSSGDNEESVNNSISLFNGNDAPYLSCDIGFCPGRTRGITIKRLEKELKQNNNELVFVMKTIAPYTENYAEYCYNIEKLNSEQAKELLSKLDAFLNKNP